VPQRDAAGLYDLPDAARRLFRSPRRLEREVRRGRAPGGLREGRWVVPVAWVEAEAGASGADAEALATFWRARLAPPSPDAHRARRPLEALGGRPLLAADEAARRLCLSPAALDRLDREGSVPSLRVDGTRRYDAALVDALASGEASDADLAAHRSELETLRRHEYESAPVAPVASLAASPEDARAPAAPEAPRAYEMPRDLWGAAGRPPRLAEADGFETVDEDA
jgi:hypothetical protein